MEGYTHRVKEVTPIMIDGFTMELTFTMESNASSSDNIRYRFFPNTVIKFSEVDYENSEVTVTFNHPSMKEPAIGYISPLFPFLVSKSYKGGQFETFFENITDEIVKVDAIIPVDGPDSPPVKGFANIPVLPSVEYTQEVRRWKDRAMGEATSGETSSSAGGVSESAAVAHWSNDDSTDKCEICHAEFGFIVNSRHHCRACGKLVCDSCSQIFLPLERKQEEINGIVDNTNRELVRVCKSCLPECLIDPKCTGRVPYLFEHSFQEKLSDDKIHVGKQYAIFHYNFEDKKRVVGPVVINDCSSVPGKIWIGGKDQELVPGTIVEVVSSEDTKKGHKMFLVKPLNRDFRGYTYAKNLVEINMQQAVPSRTQGGGILQKSIKKGQNKRYNKKYNKRGKLKKKNKTKKTKKIKRIKRTKVTKRRKMNKKTKRKKTNK